MRIAVLACWLVALSVTGAAAQSTGGSLGGSDFSESAGEATRGSSSRSSGRSRSAWHTGHGSSTTSSHETSEESHRAAPVLTPEQMAASAALPENPSYPALASPAAFRLPVSTPSAATPAVDAPERMLPGPPNLTLGAEVGGGAGVACFLVLGFVVSMATRRRPAAAPASGEREMRRLSVGIDWTARAAIQRALAELAASGGASTRAGRAAILERVIDEIRAAAARGACRYACWTRKPASSRDELETTFKRAANDLRARFRAELVRNESTSSGPELRARESEGAGLVVVSIVVALEAPRLALPGRFDVEALHEALLALRPTAPNEMWGLEIVWSPVAEQDRMSSAELETLYRELVPFDQAAALGVRACAYCRAPYTAELTSCPTCGAPAAERSR